MYSASAQSTSRFLVMSARPHRIRERPTGGKGQPEGPRTRPPCPKQPEPKGPGQGCAPGAHVSSSTTLQPVQGAASLPWKEQVRLDEAGTVHTCLEWGASSTPHGWTVPTPDEETGAAEGSHSPTATAIRCLNLSPSAQAIRGAWRPYPCTDPETCTQSRCLRTPEPPAPGGGNPRSAHRLVRRGTGAHHLQGAQVEATATMCSQRPPTSLGSAGSSRITVSHPGYWQAQRSCPACQAHHSFHRKPCSPALRPDPGIDISLVLGPTASVAPPHPP